MLRDSLPDPSEGRFARALTLAVLSCWLVASTLSAVVQVRQTSPKIAQSAGQIAGQRSAAKEMPARFAEWLASVEPLITSPERRLFLRLERDYQRDAFIREFWRVRDPHPETARNEARERWQLNLQYVRSNYGGITDARSQVLLVHGRPTRRIEVRCSTARIPAEIWIYQGGGALPFRTVLVFVRPLLGSGPASLWVPGRSGSIEGSIRAARSCMNGSMLVDTVASLRAQGAEYERRLAAVLTKPRPRNMEWVTTFASETTDLPAGAELFPATLAVDFLGRHRSRTVAQGTVVVAEREATRANLAGYHSYDFDLVGEIVREQQLLESFRYKFSIPVRGEGHSEPSDRGIPMAFQRYVRPGEYTLAVLVRDLNANRAPSAERPMRCRYRRTRPPRAATGALPSRPGPRPPGSDHGWRNSG